MNHSRGVVESTPKILINSVKDFVSNRSGVVQLTLTTAERETLPFYAKTTTSKPYFGGERFWFQCSACGYRVGILYLNEAGNYLTCRKCAGLYYCNQRYSKSSRLFVRYFDIVEREEAVFDGLERVTFLYRGKPTRRFQRFLKNRHKAERLSRLFIN